MAKKTTTTATTKKTTTTASKKRRLPQLPTTRSRAREWRFSPTSVKLVAWIGLLIFIIMGIINALTGRMKPLPLIGKLRS